MRRTGITGIGVVAPGDAREARVEMALSVGDGFGGFQSAMLFGRPRGER